MFFVGIKGSFVNSFFIGLYSVNVCIYIIFACAAEIMLK